MAIRFDGVEFDTVEELLSYKKLIDCKPTVKESNVRFYQTKRYRRRWYTVDEKDLIKKHYLANIDKYVTPYHIPVKQLANELNRKPTAIQTFMNRKEKEWLKENDKEVKKTKRKTTSDKSRNRMKFIHTKIKEYMNTFPNMNYEQAFKRSSHDWNDRKLVVKTEQKPRFPWFRPLTKKSNHLFRLMLEDLAAGNLKLINYDMVCNLELDGNAKWTINVWHDIITQMMENLYVINAMLNVVGKWKFLIENDGQVIRYGGR